MLTPVTVYQSNLELPLIARGKVRDIYDAGHDRVLLVSTDRLSAFDVVFPDPIPKKGEVLNRLSAFWFSQTGDITENHLISAQPETLLPALAGLAEMEGRCSLCHTAKPFPVECVVRGYLEGSAWNDYKATGIVSGVQLPSGLKRRERLAHPIFTPSTKAESGHDEPISFERVVELIGHDAGEALRHISLQLFSYAHDRLLKKGIVLSDTKFEFGLRDGKIILIDEAMTPDSSRFWEAESYHPDGDPRSFDKQYVRDYVEQIGWNKKPPAPELPVEVIAGTTGRYTEIYERITEASFNKEKVSN